MIETKLDRKRYVLGDASAHVGLLNIERISDRWHIHGWKVEPHYHEGLAQLFIFECGGIEARIDYELVQLKKPSVVWLPPLCSHGFLYPENADGWVLTIPSSDVMRIAAGHNWLERWIQSPRVLDSAEVVQECGAIAQQIDIEDARYGEEHNVVLEALFLLLLVKIYRGLASAKENPDSTPDRRQSLFNRFQELLDTHLHRTRLVADYAEMLSVTPTHLSRSIRPICGRTAGEIIHDRVMLAAKRELVFSDKSVAQIGYELQFSTPSYFTRFFAQQEGETPRRFRDRMRNPPGGTAF